jgi:hypothetical protein
MPYENPISYSGKSLYRKCPFLWYDNYILGNRRPSGSAADRGVYLHELLESFFKGEAPYPSGNRALAPWQPFMERLAAYNPTAEGEVAVTKEWQRCDFDDPEARFRGKKDLDIEAGRTLMLFDWKSGKVYPDHEGQGKMYAALSPGYDKYVTFFVYLDIPFYIQRWEYTAEEVDAERLELEAEAELIRNDTEFLPTPGDHCKWCHMSWRNGGNCKRAP